MFLCLVTVHVRTGRDSVKDDFRIFAQCFRCHPARNSRTHPNGHFHYSTDLLPNPSDVTVVQQVRQTGDPNNPILETRDLNLYLQAKQQRQLMQLQQSLQAEIEEGILQVETREDRVVITIDEQASFPSGLATIKPDFLPVLAVIAEALAETDDPLVVSGHTDDRPLNTPQYRSNWELSGSRATSVVHELLRFPAYEAERFRVEGYADTRPITENSTESGRARNRRVEIAVLTQ